MVDRALIDWALNYSEKANKSATQARYFFVIDSFAKLTLIKVANNGHVLSDETFFKLKSKIESPNCNQR